MFTGDRGSCLARQESATCSCWLIGLDITLPPCKRCVQHVCCLWLYVCVDARARVRTGYVWLVQIMLHGQYFTAGAHSSARNFIFNPRPYERTEKKADYRLRCTTVAVARAARVACSSVFPKIYEAFAEDTIQQRCSVRMRASFTTIRRVITREQIRYFTLFNIQGDLRLN